MGNYVIAGVGNYVIENPSDLGKFMIADTIENDKLIWPHCDALIWPHLLAGFWSGALRYLGEDV